MSYVVKFEYQYSAPRVSGWRTATRRFGSIAEAQKYSESLNKYHHNIRIVVEGDAR